MTALNDFVVAAGSYFGLPEGRVVHGSTVETADGEMELVLRMVLSTDDVVGVAKRMAVMQREAEVDANIAAKAREGAATGLSLQELAEEWHAMPRPARSAYGSFHVFKVKRREAAEAEAVQQ